MTYAENCLEGKVILITGGMGAIGKVVVSRLLAHSARVVINDLISAQETQKFAIEAQWPADRFFYIQSDITRRAECQELVSSAFKRFQRLDITLCHAGMAQSCPILEYSEADWDRILNLNLKSAFMVAQASAQAMIQQGIKGKIIFTSSWVQDVPWPNITPYNVSKSGMKMLMRGMARELAPHGIRVNSIAPGIVAVGMAKRQWDTEPDYRRRAQKAIPLGYMQPPESVADSFLFLCSDASDYITGTTLLVDGGCSLYPMD